VIEGRVTGISDGAIRGWIASDSADGGRHVEALAEGEAPFGRARAVPGADGRLHFAIVIPPALRDGRVRFLDVRPLGESRALSGGPVVFDGGLFDAPRPPIGPAPETSPSRFAVEGSASLTRPDRVEGWAWAPDEPERRLRLEIVAAGRVIATITADKVREDLKAEGVGDGRYGFWFDPSRLLRRGPHQLSVRVEGAGAALSGCPIEVGPFAADGEADCPGYLDEEPERAALEALPFEHLAWDARRIAPDRLVPRLINRLRRERAARIGQDNPAALLILLGQAEEPAKVWRLQSWPNASQIEAAKEGFRDAVRTAERVFFARPGDLIHPSAAMIVIDSASDVVTWNRFCADDARASSAGTVLRRPDFDPVTARHGAMTDTTLAVRGEILARAPEVALTALAAGRLHPLWFWLSGEDLSWFHQPEALTTSVGPPSTPGREELGSEEAFFRRLLREEGASFRLERTGEDLPSPFVLVPSRRASRISVLMLFRDRRELTLRCLASLARQRISGDLELILVDNQSRPGETTAVTEGAHRLFGEDRVRVLAYDRPFSHSAQNNLAARAASGDALVFCNNDVVLKDPSLVEQLAAWSLHPGIGAVGCRLEDPDRGVGSFGHAFGAATEDPFQPPMRENPDPFFGGFVHAAPGATLALAAMARERFLALGGLDETRFPIGYNDIDLMLRASRAGLKHLYLGHAWAEHARGSSRTGDNEDLQALRINQAFPEAASGRLGQLARERIETLREDLSGARPQRKPEPAEAPDEIEALEAEVQARRSEELKRAEIAQAYGRAADLVRALEQELAAAKAIGG
jgi:GT2 family glycosyltransferase